MASAASIKTGEAFVQIFVKDAEAQASLKALQGRMRSFAAEVTAIGKGLMFTGAAGGASLGHAVKVFSGYADKMSAVKAVINATNDETERLHHNARKLAGSFKASQIADGMLELGRAGFDTNEVIASLPGTLNLARAGAIQLGEATSILANTLRSFEMAAGEADQVGDVLAMTANISTTDIKGIGDAMKHVASSANLLGQSLERVSAALAIMANRGLQGELAGTALARTLVQLADADTSARLFKDFGIQVGDAKGNMRDILDIMADLNKATQYLGNQEKLALFKDLFDQRGMKGAISIAENIEEWDRITQALKDAGGTSARIAEEMDNNVGGAFRRLAASAENVKIAIGEALDHTLRGWAGSLKTALDSLTAFIDAHGDLIANFVKFGAVATTAGVALYAFGKGAALVTNVVGLVGRLAGGFQALHDRLMGVTAARQANEKAVANQAQANQHYLAMLDKQEKAQDRVTGAQKRLDAAAQVVQRRKRELAQAEAAHTAAVQNESTRRQAVAEAEAKAISATRATYTAQDKHGWFQNRQERYPEDANLQGKTKDAGASSKVAQREMIEARSALTVESRKLAAAENDVDAKARQVNAARQALSRSENTASGARQQLSKQSTRLAHAEQDVAAGAGRVNGAAKEM